MGKLKRPGTRQGDWRTRGGQEGWRNLELHSGLPHLLTTTICELHPMLQFFFFKAKPCYCVIGTLKTRETAEVSTVPPPHLKRHRRNTSSLIGRGPLYSEGQGRAKPLAQKRFPWGRCKAREAISSSPSSAQRPAASNSLQSQKVLHDFASPWLTGSLFLSPLFCRESSSPSQKGEPHVWLLCRLL